MKSDKEKLEIALTALQNISQASTFIPGPCEEVDDDDFDMSDYYSGNADDDVDLGIRMGEYYAATTAREAIDEINKS